MANRGFYTQGFSITGLADLKRELQGLPLRLEKNIMRGALRAGGDVIAKEARRQVPVRTGKLRKSIRVSTRILRGGRILARIKAGGNGENDAFYAHMVEYGTARHSIKAGSRRNRKGALSLNGNLVASVSHPGAAPRPFMRPAFDKMHRPAVQSMAEYIRRRLQKETALKVKK